MGGYPLRPMLTYPMGRDGTSAIARMRTKCQGVPLPFSATKIFLINHLHLSKALGHSPSHRVICRCDAEKRECPPFLPVPFRLRFLIPPQKPRSPPPQRDLFLLVIRTFLIKHPHLSEDRSDAACRVGQARIYRNPYAAPLQAFPPPPGQRQHATLGLEIAWTQPIA